jgi:myo-inositol-1(or 4)-monophosphatase
MKLFLDELAGISGRVLLKYFRKNVKIEFKGKTNPVTQADKESEQALKEKIARRFPNDRFICEESCPLPGEIDKNSRYWIIDPLDGTVNFMHGLGIFCVSIAVMENGEVSSGIVYNPHTGEKYYAGKGKGAFRNGKRVSVSKINGLEKSLLVTGFPYYTYKNPKHIFDLFQRLSVKAQGMRRIGSAALDLCLVASGAFEGFWEENLGPWDVAAGSLIVKEAGGRVTDYSGGNDYIFGRKIVAANPAIHPKILKVIRAH